MERVDVAVPPEPKKRSKPAPAAVEAEVVVSRRNELTPYTVVARRYRPQRLEDVVGQDHVVRALRNAIRMNRIAQAYLFCGTRGVGKTSIARIFAKCLNCVKGPTEDPCQTCDICQAIAQGQDVDVIEIDGASNNGVEQVRELRQNAALRPSRARYKIYYIDEVHMLSTGAFNALLKTLEEPPPHVKFFFATTEANKIPITVLSRCQRYDFAGITPDLIATTLRAICEQEKVEADPEALQVVARRAGGSLRDAQSLLDQLFASGSPRLTVEVVHGLLGTASDERLLAMLEALANHDAAAALRLVDQGMSEGVQPTELLGGVIDFVRDAMMLAFGADSLLLAISPRRRPELKRIVDRWTINSILAALQILSEYRSRMRGSLHGRLLVEIALTKVTQLENLTALGPLVDRLAALESGAPRGPRSEGGRPGASPDSLEIPAASSGPALALDANVEQLPKKARAPETPAASVGPASAQPPPIPVSATPPAEPPTAATPVAAAETTSAEPPQPASSPTLSAAGREPSPPSPGGELPALDIGMARKVWPDLVKKVPSKLKWRLSQVEPIAVVGTDVLIIAARSGFNSQAVEEDCGTPDVLGQLEKGLQKLIHRPVTIKYERTNGPNGTAPDASQPDARGPDALMADPMLQKVVELFEARPLQLEYEDLDPAPQA
jgi:DNA polymerase III subunit gamma/tau